MKTWEQWQLSSMVKKERMCHTFWNCKPHRVEKEYLLPKKHLALQGLKSSLVLTFFILKLTQIASESSG
jgi:hypothetical protein